MLMCGTSHESGQRTVRNTSDRLEEELVSCTHLQLFSSPQNVIPVSRHKHCMRARRQVLNSEPELSATRSVRGDLSRRPIHMHRRCNVEILDDASIPVHQLARGTIILS